MQISYLWCSKLWLTAALVLACSSTWADGRIVKWVDEKGVTHYGDSIPPQYSGRDHSELDRQGRAVKRNKAEDSQANKAAAEEPKVSAEQQRHDSALLAAYTTEQEFDLARDRNLEMDETAMQSLNQRMGSAKTRLAATKKTADGFNQNKKPVPPNVTQGLKENQDEIAKIETQIAERQQSMDATRQRFEKDKQRFIQLKRDPHAPPPAAAPAPAPEATEVAAEAAPAPKPVPVAVPKPVAAKATTSPEAPITPTAATKPAATPAPVAAAPATKPAPVAATKPVAEKPTAAKPVKKIKRVVMP